MRMYKSDIMKIKTKNKKKEQPNNNSCSHTNEKRRQKRRLDHERDYFCNLQW